MQHRPVPTRIWKQSRLRWPAESHARGQCRIGCRHRFQWPSGKRASKRGCSVPRLDRGGTDAGKRMPERVHLQICRPQRSSAGSLFVSTALLVCEHNQLGSIWLPDDIDILSVLANCVFGACDSCQKHVWRREPQRHRASADCCKEHPARLDAGTGTFLGQDPCCSKGKVHLVNTITKLNAFLK